MIPTYRQISDKNYEIIRDQSNLEQILEAYTRIWHAGGCLVAIEGDSKRPIGKWKNLTKKTRPPLQSITLHVKQGGKVGIIAAGRDLPVYGIDIDGGGEKTLHEVIEIMGAHPLVTYESSRNIKIDGTKGLHCWYKPLTDCTRNKWAHGELFTNHSSNAVIYNPIALADAIDLARMPLTDAYDINKLIDARPAQGATVVRPVAPTLHNYDAPVYIDPDTIPTAQRHPTAIASIASACNTSSTRKEYAAKVKLIIDTHKLAVKDDKTRAGDWREEINSMHVFAEGIWAKRNLRKSLEPRIAALCSATQDPQKIAELIAPIKDEYKRTSITNQYPTTDKCDDEIDDFVKHMVSTIEYKKTALKEAKELRVSMAASINKTAQERLKTGEPAGYIVDAGHGTYDSFIQAVDFLGVQFRLDTFADRKHVFIPEYILDKNHGGGNWVEIDDEKRSAISAMVERHTLAHPINSDKPPIPVSLNAVKERKAVDSIYAANIYNPIKDYFRNLPEWCGEDVLAKSMERGGMEVDAGPFTQAVQRAMFFDVVRNCIYPGHPSGISIVLYEPVGDYGKTKYVTLALPEHLREYLNPSFSVSGSLKVRLERSIGKALMICDEFGNGGPRDWNEIKNWMSIGSVTGERMAYRENAKTHQLTATTVFTTNNPELPPTDKAALRRFIWVKVLTKATRKKDKKGNDLPIIFHHFDELYDPEIPDYGTWRDQYWAQAYTTIKEKSRAITQIINGEKKTKWVCDYSWLPQNTSSEDIVNWNLNSNSATYSTDQSIIIEEIKQGLNMIADAHETADLSGFYPNCEIKAAIYAVRHGLEYDPWFEIVIRSKQDDLMGTKAERLMDRIDKIITPKALANAIKHVATELNMTCTRGVSWWSDAGKTIRGVTLASKSGPITTL